MTDDAPPRWRRVSEDPEQVLGRERSNRDGERNDRERHADWFAFLEASAPNHALKAAEARIYLRRISETLGPAASASSARSTRLLDVGGGTGRLAIPLARAGHHVTLVERSTAALADAARAVETDAVEGVELAWGCAYDLAALGNLDHDAALVLEVLCYLEEPASALDQIARHVRPGGHIFVSAEAWPAGLAVVPDLTWREVAAAVDTHVLHRDGDLFVRYYDLADLEALAAAAGLEIESVEPTHHVLEGIFAQTVTLEELAEPDTAEAVVALERRLAKDPATAALGRAWFATLRKP